MTFKNEKEKKNIIENKRKKIRSETKMSRRLLKMRNCEEM